MTWLHTWAGVTFAGLLFAIFWTGTTSVFDRELDQWTMPATRLPAPPAALSLDALRPSIDALTRGSPDWFATLPYARSPALQIGYTAPSGEPVIRHFDPASGVLLPDVGTLGATRFIFQFHYTLNLKWMKLGQWLVGAAGMAWLVLLVSGVVIHKKIFTEFFTFRPKKHRQRNALDLHTVTAVLALPFYVVLALSGLIIFYSIYFQSGWQVAYRGDREAWAAEAGGPATRTFTRPSLKRPGSLSSLDAMVAHAERLWVADGEPGPASYVRVWNAGDASSYVEVRRSFEPEITMTRRTIYFDAASGNVLMRENAHGIMKAQRFIAGLHFIQFGGRWILRWLYFLVGLGACAMDLTGLLFWLETRRVRHVKEGRVGVRLVEGLAIGSTTGAVIATLSFLVTNRLLPLGLAGRASIETSVFYGSWMIAFAHAWLRKRSGWREQAWAIATLAALAVTLNWITTGDHLLRTLRKGNWVIAGIDSILLFGTFVAVVAARKLQSDRLVLRAGAERRGSRAGAVHAASVTE
jgi:uncharacterized iron-regulated membrane protein